MYDVRRRHEGSAVGPIVHYTYPTYRDYPSVRHDEMLRNETKLNKQTRERERERERECLQLIKSMCQNKSI